MLKNDTKIDRGCDKQLTLGQFRGKANDTKERKRASKSTACS